ncbi:MAG: aminotransferase class I/II-fold pyridoxal phosphate-dependent enzyme [Acidobacteriia bacterium]|nr:aminotransferase class I/II-fold pyridoxal phosphate-dependent enzyme [Terriglobia bacterium]
MFELESMKLLLQAAQRLEQGFAGLPPFSPEQPDEQGLREVLFAAADRLRDNFPYFHPLYAGQMLKPPHPVARLAYMLSLWINPNNHALDGGRASSRMEKEAVAELAAMFGWSEFLGHLCGGGTMANLEALWVAGQERPGKTILASEQAHYTHNRISAVLRISYESVACDARGRMDMAALKARLERGGVGAVVATLGATGTGAVDPLPEILELCGRHGARVHVDAAYGGYFTLADNLGAAALRAFARIGEADSIVIDPHKHGLQPYGCGCVLFRDPAAGRHYKHDSPYTYFSSTELHLGEISLECSRPGASAVALWATQKLLPLVRGGELARGLAKGRSAALALFEKLRGDARFVTAFEPELDVLVFAPAAETAEEVSALSRRIFECAARRNLHVALAKLPGRFFSTAAAAVRDAGELTCLRLTLMKPEHEEWLGKIWEILDAATEDAGAGKR